MNRTKWISLILAVLMAFSLLSACGTAQNTQASATPEVSAPASDAVASQQPQASGTVTVTDAAGRSVTLTDNVQGIVTMYALKYVMALGLGDRILNGTTDEFCTAVVPSLAQNGNIQKDGNISVEAIAAMEPDVFIHKSALTDVFDSLEQLGIPSIGIHMETVEEIKSTLQLLGEALGVKDRAQQLCDYYTSLMDKAADLTADVAESDKVTAILMGSSLGKVAHGGMLQSVMMETAGAKNMAADVEGEGTWPVVGTEQIFAWDPDYIFIQNSVSCEYTVEDLKQDSAWAELKAVKNDHVYVVPSDLDSWEYPGLESAIGTLWMVHTMYPDKYSDGDLEQDVTNFYQTVFNASLTRDQLGY